MGKKWAGGLVIKVIKQENCQNHGGYLLGADKGIGRS